jgi:hypothetical protein
MGQVGRLVMIETRRLAIVVWRPRALWAWGRKPSRVCAYSGARLPWRVDCGPLSIHGLPQWQRGSQYEAPHHRRSGNG